MSTAAPKQFWAGANSRRIDRRVVVEGDLILLTPAHFGNGASDEATDMPLLVDTYDGVSPLLTGTTLAGALRSYLYAREKGWRAMQPQMLNQQEAAESRQTLTGLLFGGFKGDDDGLQSALIVDDALGQNYGIDMRDGVKIDGKSRTAFHGGLFDMQVWRTGTKFPIRFELVLARPRPRKKTDEGDHWAKYQQDLKRALVTALEGLPDGGITLGARKYRGFGRITVKNWRVKAFDMRDTAQHLDWILNGARSLSAQGVEPIAQLTNHNEFKNCTAPDRRHWLQVEATFSLDGSLLIGSTGRQNNASDLVHVSNHAGRPVLPGTSVTGALRARATRILNLISPIKLESWVDDLFGADLHVKGDQRKKGGGKASRLMVEEHLIEKPEFDLVQNRVAIDRFTGGALETALFNEHPVWGIESTRLKIHLRLINPKPYEIGLLLLLLKDLWTGDLALGGESSIGRGRLEGRHAKVTLWENGASDHWEITQADKTLLISDSDRETLEKFVKELGEEAAR